MSFSLYVGHSHPYNQWPRFNSPPDVSHGKYTYTHQGWYRPRAYNNRGQTSIWFKWVTLIRVLIHVYV